MSIFYRTQGKRLFDLMMATAGITILSGLFAAIGISILIMDGKPVLFRQDRVGRRGRIFKLMKFRSMMPDAALGGTVTVAGDQRVTPLGRLLRRHKLDELPQLLNVLIGNMSFVGPRPDVPGYADCLQEERRGILELRPGITGPATLAFRNEEELLATVQDPVRYNDEVIYPKKVELNFKYYKEMSFLKDLEYIMQTLFPTVLS